MDNSKDNPNHANSVFLQSDDSDHMILLGLRVRKSVLAVCLLHGKLHI
jgi:hypothetical protein